jgi:hypothetical protein
MVVVGAMVAMVAMLTVMDRLLTGGRAGGRHAGTPNVSKDEVRAKPAASFVAPWWPSQPDARPMTRRAWRSLSSHGRKTCAALVSRDEEDFPAEFYGPELYGYRGEGGEGGALPEHKPYHRLVGGHLHKPAAASPRL